MMLKREYMAGTTLWLDGVEEPGQKELEMDMV